MDTGDAISATIAAVSLVVAGDLRVSADTHTG